MYTSLFFVTVTMLFHQLRLGKRRPNARPGTAQPAYDTFEA
jgi:hypothetical protein